MKNCNKTKKWFGISKESTLISTQRKFLEKINGKIVKCWRNKVCEGVKLLKKKTQAVPDQVSQTNLVKYLPTAQDMLWILIPLWIIGVPFWSSPLGHSVYYFSEFSEADEFFQINLD